MKNINVKMIVLVFAAVCTSSIAIAEEVTVQLEHPKNGSLVIAPPIPANGKVDAGTRVIMSAIADSGYQLDSLYAVVPGPFGNAYLESMTSSVEIVIDQGMSLSALFIPEAEFLGFTFIDNIVYAQPGVKPLKYDVWSPDNASNLPIVVIIHGGGWIANSEDIMRGMAREIVRTGKYVVVSLDYRWAGFGDGDNSSNDMADIIGDVFGGIAHIQEHAKSYGGDSAQIAVTGDSAGAHLAAVVATMSHKIGEGGFGELDGIFEFMPSYLPPNKTLGELSSDIMQSVKVGAPSYGVFSDETEGTANLSHQSDDPEASQSWAAAIAPIHFIPSVDTKQIPQYFLRGTEDFLIQDSMVQDYVDALQVSGQTAVYEQVEGANHAFFDWKPDQQARNIFTQYGVEYVGKMVEFFDAVFYP